MEQSPSSEANSSSVSQKFPAFFGTRKFIFASTRAHHISILEPDDSRHAPILFLEDPF
jgi:hypothetical protein